MDVGQWFVDQRTATLNDLSPWGAGLADTFSKIIVTAIIAVVMLRVWKRWVEPLVVVVTLIFEASVFITVTTLVSRPRPPFEHLQDSPVNSSFPSGHVAAAAAYAAISLVWSWHVRSRSARVAIWSIPVLITTVVVVVPSLSGNALPHRRVLRDRAGADLGRHLRVGRDSRPRADERRFSDLTPDCVRRKAGCNVHCPGLRTESARSLGARQPAEIECSEQAGEAPKGQAYHRPRSQDRTVRVPQAHAQACWLGLGSGRHVDPSVRGSDGLPRGCNPDDARPLATRCARVQRISVVWMSVPAMAQSEPPDPDSARRMSNDTHTRWWLSVVDETITLSSVDTRTFVLYS